MRASTSKISVLVERPCVDRPVLVRPIANEFLEELSIRDRLTVALMKAFRMIPARREQHVVDVHANDTRSGRIEESSKYEIALPLGKRSPPKFRQAFSY